MLEENISDISGMYTGKIKLLARDVDCADKWKLSSVFVNMQEAANLNCLDYGCDWISLNENYNACFVLTRMVVRMKFYPHSSDIVKVSTWPGRKPRLVFPRYFTYETENGERIGEAVSQWVLLNLTTRAIMKPSECEIDTPDTDHIQVPFEIERPDYNFEPQATGERIPVYSDLDYNGHVNNARYIEWIMDLFPLEHFAENETAEIDIKYEKEIKWGSKVLMDYRYDKDSGSFFVKGYDEEGQIHFRAKGIFRKV